MDFRCWFTSYTALYYTFLFLFYHTCFPLPCIACNIVLLDLPTQLLFTFVIMLSVVGSPRIILPGTVSEMNQYIHTCEYCKTTYSRSGINQVLILKNSKELLLENLKSPNVNNKTLIKSSSLSTLYICTTTSHQTLITDSQVIWKFLHTNICNCRYTYLILGHQEAYLILETSTLKMP